MNLKIGKPSKEQLLCILITAVMAVLAYFFSGSAVFTSENTIQRGTPGDVDRQYTVNVTGIGEETEKLNIKVSPKEFTEAEAMESMDALMEELSIHILGENESLNHVSTDLDLVKTVSGHEGVHLSWYPDDTKLISYEGIVNNIELKSPVETSLNVVLRADDYRETFTLPVTVYPAEITGPESLKEKLLSLIENADSDQIYDEALILPDSVDGIPLSYSEPPDTTWIMIIAVGLFAFLLLGLKPEQDRRQNLKQREDELLLDYSDVISKLVVYMGAGLTTRNAWIKIAENYSEAVESGKSEKRAVYEEMLKTANELQKGVPESKAYQDFAENCSLACYQKLVSLLEQERRTGDPRSSAALLMEAREAFEQRKNAARRLGEEAGTKLMLPLIALLSTVLIIVGAPAILNFR